MSSHDPFPWCSRYHSSDQCPPKASNIDESRPVTGEPPVFHPPDANRQGGRISGTRNLRPVYLIASLLLAGLVAYWRFHNTPFNWATFAANFTDVKWGWAGLSVALILLTYMGRAIRWEVMMRHLNAKLPFITLISCTMIGFTATVLSGRPGEFVRPYLIATKARVPMSTQLAAWAIERILDLLMVLLLFGAALSQVSRGAAVPGSKLQLILRTGGGLIGILAALALVLLLGFRHFQGRAQQRISDALSGLPAALHGKVDKFLQSFSDGAEALRSLPTILTLVTYSILEWIVIGLSFYAILQAFPATSALPPTDVVVILGFISFGSAIQIPGIGGGMQVAAIFVLTELYQLSFEEASGLALAFWLVSYVSVVPVGLLFAFHEGLNWKKLKNIEEEVGDEPKFPTTIV